MLLALSIACRKPAEPAPPPPPKVEAPPAQIAEQEPNDFQRPQAIPPRAIVTGSLSSAKDSDWYRVEATLVLRVETTAGRLRIYDRDRNRLLDARGVVPAVACVEACFVEVWGGTGPYTVTVLGDKPQPGREVEPNDRAADATLLAPGAPMQGTFLDDDQDWYRLEVPTTSSGGVLRVEVSPVEGVRPSLEVRALSDGALLASFRPLADGSLYVRDLSMHLDTRTTAPAASPDAGMADAGVLQIAPPLGYFLVLSSRKAAPLTPYTLKASIDPGGPDFEQEPNDDAQHATPLAGPTATGYLAPAGDQDWYKLQADAPSVLHAELSGMPGADLAIYAPADKLLARVSEGDVKIAPSVGLPAGDAFVVVRAREGEDRDNPYHLALVLSPDDGSTDREPNDDVASAQMVTLPVSIKGYIWPRKDADFYRFHVAAGHAPVSITLSAVRNVDLALRLYELHGAASEVIGSSDVSKGEGEEKLLSVPLKEGDFAVEVSSPRNKDASPTDPYTLAIQ